MCCFIAVRLTGRRDAQLRNDTDASVTIHGAHMMDSGCLRHKVLLAARAARPTKVDFATALDFAVNLGQLITAVLREKGS